MNYYCHLNRINLACNDDVQTNKECPKNMSEAGYRCVCLNARSIVNKKNELNIMVEDIDPHIIGITESWANTDLKMLN